MSPVHKAIITQQSIIDTWFTSLLSAQAPKGKKVPHAHRNPGGCIYALNMNKVNQSLQNLTASETQKIQNSAFMISTLADKQSRKLRNEFYISIIDRSIYTQINTRRWIPKRDINYWTTGTKTAPMLHTEVVSLFNRPVPPGDDIHHNNFFTFDNRDKNLVFLTASAHRQRHSGITMRNAVYITNDQGMIDFIQNVVVK